MTGVEVIIGNCLPKVDKILPDFRNWEEKISNNTPITTAIKRATLQQNGRSITCTMCTGRPAHIVLNRPMFIRHSGRRQNTNTE